MFWRKKKTTKCVHDWHELRKGKEYIDHTTYGVPDGRYENVSHIYCPKCDTRKRVSLMEGELIIKANEIRKKYQTS